MFQIQPFLTYLGITPYFKESALKSIVNSLLFIDFINVLSLTPNPYFCNVARLKNTPMILQKYPNAENVKYLFLKYFQFPLIFFFLNSLNKKKKKGLNLYKWSEEEDGQLLQSINQSQNNLLKWKLKIH